MKNRKLKAKKGMTLIEVIISVTLLSILIVPISGFMLSSLKNNMSSQKKQEASYIGQKVLEELKAYEYISLKKDNEGYYFELLDGDKIYRNQDDNFEVEIERDIYGKPISKRNINKYNVYIKIEENTDFKYNDINNLEVHEDADCRIDFINDNNINFIRIMNSNLENKNSFTGEIKINIKKEDNNFSLSLYDKNDQDIKIENIKKEIKNNKILLYLASNYEVNTNIEINNDTEEVLYLYLIKEDDKDKMNLVVNRGKVILSEEKEIITNNIGSMYEYNVKVTDDKNNILFEGKSSNNINIR